MQVRPINSEFNDEVNRIRVDCLENPEEGLRTLIVVMPKYPDHPELYKLKELLIVQCENYQELPTVSCTNIHHPSKVPKQLCIIMAILSTK